MRREFILNFHGIGKPHAAVDAGEASVWVSRATFVALLDEVVALRSYVAPKIRITFDDGNMSDATIAMPELLKRDLTAIFFVCSGRVGARHHLDRRAIGDLLDCGMQIGSHGMHHRDWRTLTAETLDEEATTARRQLEDICGGPVTRAAIPFGSYDRRVLARLRKENFKTVYTSDTGLGAARCMAQAAQQRSRAHEQKGPELHAHGCTVGSGRPAAQSGHAIQGTAVATIAD